ncbi:hypothetical protein R5R35_010839 [Gryllus longicercus]|uniref:Uncharacterized protein n=1 Tax=Gryllus longicercus TaxID=2509291 RepID=A0AAN9W067_9ORTH
MANTSDSR